MKAPRDRFFRPALKLSYDDGKAWPVSQLLEPGVAACSDLAVGGDGKVYCFYERDGVNGSMWDTKFIPITRFSLEWLRAGRNGVK